MPRRVSAWVAGLCGLAVVAVGVAPLTARAAAAVPASPTAIAAYQGVGGVVVAWAPPRGGESVGGYEVQRSGSTGGFGAVGTAGAGDRRFADVTALEGQTYRYRVVATNEAGASAPTRVRSVEVPSVRPPGSVTRFVVLGAPGTPWEGGVGFAGSEVSLTRLNDREYEVRGVSAADSAQGAREVAFVLGSAAGGTRVPTGGYREFRTVGAGQPNAAAPALYPSANDQSCARAGILRSSVGSFTADGTPLVIDATFEYCGTRGYLRWNATTDTGTQLTAAPVRLQFEPGGAGTSTVTLRNVGGGVVRTLGSAKLDDYAGAAPAGYAIGADSCSGVALAPGAQCQVSVAGDLPAGGVPPARLLISDGTNQSAYEVPLADGPDVPAPPTNVLISNQSSWRGAPVWWNAGTSSPPTSGYSIYRGTSEANLTKIADVGADAGGFYLDRSAAPDTLYVYEVTQTNAVGESRKSNGNFASAGRTGTFASTTLWSAGTDRDIAVLGANEIPVRLTSAAADETDPVVTPDNSAFVYASNAGNAAQDYDLWVQPFPGSPRRLTQDPATSDGTPAISRDGTSVAFTRTAQDGTTSVWTVPFAGGAALQVSGSNGDSAPEWAPSGRVLAVSHATAEGSSILITNLTGGFRRTIPGTDQAGVRSTHPVWSATNIVYIRTGAATSQLVLVSPFDGQASNLTAGTVTPTALGAGPIRIFEGSSPTAGHTLWSTDSQAVGGSELGIFEAPSAAGQWGAYTPQNIVGPNLAGTTIASGSATVSWSQAPVSSMPYCIVCGVWTIVRRGLPNDYNQQLTKPTDGLPVYEGDATSATATGLTNGKEHKLALFALNVVGDISPAVTHGAAPAAPPVVKPNGTSLSALSGDGPAFTATFGPKPGIGAGYEAQIASRPLSTAGGAGPASFAAFSSGEANSKVVKAKPGTVYYLRARYVDNYYNPTAWSPVATVAVPYDDRAFKVAGTWAALTKQKGRFGGTIREANGAGAALTGTVHGSFLALIVETCPTCGKIKIFIDGKRVATVNTYAKKAALRRQVWSANVAPGAHTVKLVAAGDKKRPKVRVDAFVARP